MTCSIRTISGTSLQYLLYINKVVVEWEEERVDPLLIFLNQQSSSCFLLYVLLFMFFVVF